MDDGWINLFVPHRWRRAVQLRLRESDLAKLPTAADLAREHRARPLASRGYPPASDRRTEQRLGKIYEYAGRRFAEAVSLADLAGQVGMSPAAFSRYFKRVTGRAPSDFLNDLRIEQACRLLRESDRKITEIAGAVGFATLTNFNRRFRERAAVTPRDYRRTFHRHE
ncbi:MAG: AraC family transcriptional regulator [Lacunisphaera sp.]|nr:AraC family transcriptional regulator [Lacunisphaera sp.]